jgi:hypothetical protein
LLRFMPPYDSEGLEVLEEGATCCVMWYAVEVSTLCSEPPVFTMQKCFWYLCKLFLCCCRLLTETMRKQLLWFSYHFINFGVATVNHE